MLDRAAGQQGPDAWIEWRQADAMALPFDDGTFDVVCCQFGMMFLPDKDRGHREALRRLQDGGRFIFSVWDRIEHNEFAHSVTAAATRFFPDDPPLFLQRIPHGYHDARAIRLELQNAGFRDIDVHTITGQCSGSSARVPAIAYWQGTPMRNELEERGAGLLEEITAAAAEDIERTFGTGPVSRKIQGHVFVAS